VLPDRGDNPSGPATSNARIPETWFNNFYNNPSGLSAVAAINSPAYVASNEQQNPKRRFMSCLGGSRNPETFILLDVSHTNK
jgi:hypothetical protein